MALTEKQIEDKKKRLLDDPEFMAKLRARLASTKPEHEFGGYQHRELVALSVECREQVALREDFEALATVAWDLVNNLVDVSNQGELVTINKKLSEDQVGSYEILSDYFESEEEDDGGDTE